MRTRRPWRVAILARARQLLQSKNRIDTFHNDALTPIFIWMVPLAVIAAVVLVFTREKPLATTIEHDVLSESISEGNILITADDDEPATAAR